MFREKSRLWLAISSFSTRQKSGVKILATSSKESLFGIRAPSSCLENTRVPLLADTRNIENEMPWRIYFANNDFLKAESTRKFKIHTT